MIIIVVVIIFTGTEAAETETSAIQPLPPLMPQK